MRRVALTLLVGFAIGCGHAAGGDEGRGAAGASAPADSEAGVRWAHAAGPVPLPGPVQGAAGKDAAGAVEPTPARPAPLPAPSVVRIPAGAYAPLYGRPGDSLAVGAFELDRRGVTRGEYVHFLMEQPSWRRGVVKPVFADPGYLAGWAAALDPGAYDHDRPVTQISWFAARAYCDWRGMRLPTTDEWEYAAAFPEAGAGADLAERRARILALYTRPRPPLPGPAAAGFTNVLGVVGLHGGVWEWVDDFQSALAPDDSRATGGRDRQLYCASGASGAADPADYAAFLRYALRSSLHGQSTLSNVGFRCARSVEP
jgi:formylglycine-generating enzyme